MDAVAAWYSAWAAAGAPGVAQRMQTRWPLLLGVVAVSVVAWAVLPLRHPVGGGAAHALGAPGVGNAPVRRLAAAPGRRLLKPSKLPAERRAQLNARFAGPGPASPHAAQRYASYRPPLKLEFRSGMPANAFALPGGTVVMTDAIVQAAADKGISDDALVGVLAHEIGHVVHRHGMRMVVEQGVLNMGLGLALGDVSGVVSTGATLLTSRAYSRSHEREADCYAIALMRPGIAAHGPMGQLLLAIAHDEEDEARKPRAPSLLNRPPCRRASLCPKAKDKGPTGIQPGLVAARLPPDTVQRATELQQGTRRIARAERAQAKGRTALAVQPLKIKCEARR